MNAVVSVSAAINKELLFANFPDLAEQSDTRLLHLRKASELDLLSNWLSQGDINILIVYSSAERALADCIRDGFSLNTEAENWLSIHERILILQRSNRSRMHFVDADQWLEFPTNWPKRLSELGFLPMVKPAVRAGTDIFLLVSTLYVQQQERLVKTNQLLKVSSYPFSQRDSTIQLDLSQVLHQHFLLVQKATQSETNLSQHIIKEKKSRLELDAQIKKTETLERSLLAYKKLSEQNEEGYNNILQVHKRQLMLQEIEMTRINSLLKQAKADNFELMAQLQIVQSKLERLSAEGHLVHSRDNMQQECI